MVRARVRARARVRVGVRVTTQSGRSRAHFEISSRFKPHPRWFINVGY